PARSRAPAPPPADATHERARPSVSAPPPAGDVSLPGAARRGRSSGRQGGRRARREEGPHWESAFPREEDARAQAEASGGGYGWRPLRLSACTTASVQLRGTAGLLDPQGVGGRSELGRGKEEFRKVLRSHLRRARRERTGRSAERVQEAMVLRLPGKVQAAIRGCAGAEPRSGSGHGRCP